MTKNNYINITNIDSNINDIFKLLNSIETIGINKSLNICNNVGININCKLNYLNDIDLNTIYNLLNDYINIIANTKNIFTKEQLLINKYNYNNKLQLLKTYKAFRIKAGLPVNGQNTHSNAKTAKHLNK